MILSKKSLAIRLCFGLCLSIAILALVRVAFMWFHINENYSHKSKDLEHRSEFIQMHDALGFSQNWLKSSHIMAENNIEEDFFSLTAHTKTGPVTLSVELAETPAQRSQGLMGREELEQNSGMLFRFDNEEVIQMWMKNTPLSLDMIFINRFGIVEGIAQSTLPYSTKIISSKKPVQYVLEVNAGVSQNMAIKIGQQLSHPWFLKNKK